MVSGLRLVWFAITAVLLAGCGRLHFDSIDRDAGREADAGDVGPKVTYAKASTPGVDDSFGELVALSGDGRTLAVATRLEDSDAIGIGGNEANNAATDSGAVYVFTSNGTSWAQQAYVKPSNTGAGDHFGRSIALSADGNTLVVGADAEDSNATGINGDGTNNASVDSGAVYVFVRSGTLWTQQSYVKPSNTGPGDNFGSSVALSADGNTLAVGAYREDSAATGVGGNQLDNAATNSGAVYLFVRAGVVWSQDAYVKASNTGANDIFGQEVAVSADGSTLAVGAPLEDSNATGINGIATDNSRSDSGAAYVFARGGGWAQQAYVKPSNTRASFQFGWGVALSANGSTLAIGARGESSGAAGVNADQSNSSAGFAGAAYMFTRAGSTWSQQTYFKASNPAANDFFGEDVKLSGDGNTLVTTAPNEDGGSVGINGTQDDAATDSGAIYSFVRTGTLWAQRDYVKATNTAAGDSVATVAISAAADVLALGASFEDSAATGIGGDQGDNSLSNSGAIYIRE